MSFAGTVQAMITSLKNNARPRAKLSETIKANNRLIRSFKKELKFKEVSREELAEIKKRIRERARKQRIRIILVLVPLIVAGLFFLSRVLITVREMNKQQELLFLDQKRKKEQAIYDKYLYYLNDGYKWLSQEKYHNAKYQFYKASEIKPNDYRTRIAVVTAYA